MRRFLALLLAGLAAALYEDEEHVVAITSPSEFEKKIIKDDSALWVVHFYQGADAPGSEDVSSPQMADARAAARRSQLRGSCSCGGGASTRAEARDRNRPL